MAKVKLLPPEIISKIAAGEVIERPASCVKELVENSLDAGASAVDVLIEAAGKKLISVTDNGSGIGREDLDSIFLRHSTSKISSSEDLYRIASLGFRGEALYSIAAIADVRLRSRTDGTDTGWETHVRGGKDMGIRPVSVPGGTSIEIRELFFNTPARRKFMKSDSTELSQIVGVLTPYSLLYPERSFSLKHNQRALLQAAGGGTLRSRAASVLHIKEENILEAASNGENGAFTIKALLGDINIQRVKKDMQFIFVNGRPVQDKSVSFHMNQAYRLIMPQGTYPFFAVFVEMPPENIDVNTHPAKREIKIKDDRSLTRALRRMTENILMTSGGAKKIGVPWVGGESAPLTPMRPAHTGPKVSEAISAPPKPGGRTQDTRGELRQYILFRGPRPAPDTDSFTNSGAVTPGSSGSFRQKVGDAEYVGPFMDKYLIFGAPGSLLLVDQHAAQERVTYEKYLRQIKSGRVEIQHLLTPITLSLSTEEKLAWEELGSHLERIGFQTTMWADDNIAVNSHPQLISSPEISVRNILAGEKEESYSDEFLARWACRSSIMAGDKVSKELALYLKSQLLACADPFTCPHGRPTVIEIEEKFISKQFGRT